MMELSRVEPLYFGSPLADVSTSASESEHTVRGAGLHRYARSKTIAGASAVDLRATIRPASSLMLVSR